MTEWVIPFLFGIVFGMFIGMLIITSTSPIPLSQQTGDDICIKLLNNTAAIASADGNSRLVCTIPSYDHTTNIIVRKAGDPSP